MKNALECVFDVWVSYTVFYILLNNDKQLTCVFEKNNTLLVLPLEYQIAIDMYRETWT